jgi:hypothetical protein
MRLLAALAAGLLLASPSPADQASEAPVALQPYRVAPSVGVWIDGLEGRMEAVGRVRRSDKIEPDTYEYRAMRERAAEEGRRVLAAAAAGLRLGDGRTLAQDPEASRRVNALIAALQPVAVRHDQSLYFEVDLTLPLRGLSGVLGMILERGVSLDVPYQNGAPAGSETTGLVVDASGLERAEPRPAMALLPRIVDDKGRVVHDISQVDVDLARERGLVAYARVASAESGSADAPSRTGDRPMRVAAIAAGGAGGTDIVIAAADADRILEAAAAFPFLRECRVTVLMPPPPPPPAISRPRHAPQRPPVDPNTLR